jgi:hypothetical protein
LPQKDSSERLAIIALVKDEQLRPPIQQLADELGAEVIWHLDVKGVIRHVAETRPLFMLVDLRNEQADWKTVLTQLRKNSATRRLGVIAFATDLDETLREEAASVFIDEVFDARDDRRGNVLTTLPTRVAPFTRQLDNDLQQALGVPCAQPMPPLVKQGLEEFNAGEYYECHETLEHAWMDEEGPVRNVYRGILQVGVAYYHIERGNYWAAVKMFLRAIQWLEPLPEVCHGIQIGQFRADTHAAREELERLGPEQIHEFELSQIAPVQYDADFVLPAEEEVHE